MSASCWLVACGTASGRVNRMSYESKARLKARGILAALFCAGIALSACTPATTEIPMTGSSNPSDPATVKAQVEQLKQALADLHAFKVETQQAIGPQKWADKGLRNMDCKTPDGEGGVNYSVLTLTSRPRRPGSLSQRRQNVLGIQGLHHPHRNQPTGTGPHPPLRQRRRRTPRVLLRKHRGLQPRDEQRLRRRRPQRNLQRAGQAGSKRQPLTDYQGELTSPGPLLTLGWCTEINARRCVQPTRPGVSSRCATMAAWGRAPGSARECVLTMLKPASCSRADISSTGQK